MNTPGAMEGSHSTTIGRIKLARATGKKETRFAMDGAVGAMPFLPDCLISDEADSQKKRKIVIDLTIDE